MSKVLNLIFTEDFFAGGVLTNADEAGATIELLEVDGFQLLPLYFELKNDSIIYLIGKEDFLSPQGRIVFGNYTQTIDSNTTFSLFGTHYALVTIITHTLDRLKEKYIQVVGKYGDSITTILSLPESISGRAKDRLKDFLSKRGFKIVQEISLPQAARLNYHSFSKIGVLDSLGKNSIDFHVVSDSDLYSEKITDFDEEKGREKVANLVFNKALQNSFSSLLNDESAKENEVKKYTQTAKEWLRTLKQKSEIDVHFTFSDGYTGTALLTKLEADDLLLDTTFILNKIRTLQDRAKAGAPIQRIFLIGEKLNNIALQATLNQQFGADKIFVLGEDAKAVKEISVGILLNYQKNFQDTAAMQIQKLIAEVGSKSIQMNDIDKGKIVLIAAEAGIPESKVNEWIEKESQKVKVIKLLGLEQITQLEEIQHPQLGKAVRKIFKEQYATDKYERTKFFTESKVLAELSHPHIAKILTVSEESDPKPHYVAQYLEGKPLNTLLPMVNEAKIRQVSLQILDALQYLHARNIWYKTLKPKNIVNTNPEEFRLVASGLELTENIGQRQRQNIKDFGLIVLEMFTGKTAYQAVASVNDERWANIIKKTSTGSSGEPYTEVFQIIKDIQEMGKSKKGSGNFNFPLKKALIWFVVFVALFLGFIFLKDKLLPFFNKKAEQISDIASTPDLSSLPNIQARFSGKFRLPSKKKADFWLTIKSLKPMQNDTAVFVYAIRIDSLSEGGIYNEREQVGELILKDKKLKLPSKDFPDWEYEQDSKRKVTLKSLNVELELE
jgi:serine/threonine protein kinase